MSQAIAAPTRLKPELRLAQAISMFEADLLDNQKLAFQNEKARRHGAPPRAQDVLRLTAEIDQVASVSKRRCFGTRMMNVLEAVQQFAALGDIIVGGSQNLIACGVWTVVRSSLLMLSSSHTTQLVTKHYSYLERLSTLFMVAGRSAPRYEKMAILYPCSKNLQSYMCDYFIILVQICHKILRFTQKSTLGQLKAALEEGELKSFQLDLERWAGNIKEEVTLLMAEKIQDEAVKTSKFQSALWKKITKSDDDMLQAKIDARLHVLNFCSQFNHTVIWKQTRKAGTTTLFRDSPEYIAWKDPALSCISCSLVYTGKLGSGKSVVLANIVEDLHLHSPEVLVAYFFCRHDVAKSLKTRTVIGSLIRQILSGVQDLTSVAEALNQCEELGEIEKMTSLLEHAFPADTLQCFMIVDGLDDLENSERIEVITELSKLQQKFNIHLCGSFRSDPTSYDLKNDLMGFVSTTVMPIPENSSDIQAFILEELENCLESQKLTVGDPTLILEIRDALFHGSQGMFLWVALQIETLCTMKTDYELRQALQDFPRDLAGTFSRILQRLEWQEPSQQGAILKLIISAQRPLTVFELQEALSVIPGDTEWDPSKSLNNIYITLASCGCLINIDEEELTARLVHPSLKQFLLNSHEQTTKAPLSLTINTAHQDMADVIFTYLSYSAFDKQLSRTVIPQIDARAATSTILQSTISSTSVRHLAIKLLKGKSEPNVDLGKTLAQARSPRRDHADQTFPFHSYANSYWGLHFAHTSEKYGSTWELLTKLLISKKLDANALDDDGLTPLMLASILGNVNAVRFYLSLSRVRVEVNMKSGSGLTAIHLALLHKQYHTFTTILRCSTMAVNLADKEGRTLLIFAAEQGDTEIFETLAHHHINRGLWFSIPVDLNCVNGSGETALHIASRLGFFGIVVVLLTLDQVDVNAKDANGNTPLHKAIQNEHEDIVEQLLMCDRVDVNAENNHRRNALSMTISSRNEDIARLLWFSRLDGESKDRLKQTRLYISPRHKR
ncbi:hypothetical protein N7486_005329 [Penicillium sp. IBT 16267x]|nr:hypothetical protein N7486_005329 [Penicillium sp. IBT 16267x]